MRPTFLVSLREEAILPSVVPRDRIPLPGILDLVLPFGRIFSASSGVNTGNSSLG